MAATVWAKCPACQVPVPKMHLPTHWCKEQQKEDSK